MLRTWGKAGREDSAPGSRKTTEASGAKGSVSAQTRLKGVRVALQNVLSPFHLQPTSRQASQTPSLQTRQATSPASYAERVFILF